MLKREHGGGHKHCDLLIIGHCLESRPHSHLRLAKSDIATDQAIHRPLTFHIGLHFRSGAHLVGGILIDKAGL